MRNFQGCGFEFESKIDKIEKKNFGFEFELESIFFKKFESKKIRIDIFKKIRIRIVIVCRSGSEFEFESIFYFDPQP